MRCGKPALWLALIGLLLRSAIAPGFMLDPAAMAKGGLKLVICTPSGAKSITVPLGKQPAPSQSGSGDICPCTVCGTGGKPADPVVLASEPLRPIFHLWKPESAVASARPLAFAARAPPAATA